MRKEFENKRFFDFVFFFFFFSFFEEGVGALWEGRLPRKGGLGEVVGSVCRPAIGLFMNGSFMINVPAITLLEYNI